VGAAPEGAGGCRMMRFGRLAAAESHLVRLGWEKLQSRYLRSTSTAAGCLEIRRRVGGSPYTKADILMIKDVAGYLKVTVRTIYRLAGAEQMALLRSEGLSGSLRRSLICGAKRNPQSTGPAKQKRSD